MTLLCAACGEQTGPGECSACGEDPRLDGRYRLEQRIGRGASGQTYRATRVDDGRTVAIKELSYRAMQSFEMEKLFRREADILKQLDHPAIPAYIDDLSVKTGKYLSLYLVQAFVDGQSLGAEMDGRRYTEQDVVDILAELADILVYLQDLRPPVFHRDIKPANVMRNTDGRLVLVDFGSVKATTDGAVGGSTVAGTFGFMAPEQTWGNASRQTDLYGLGALGLALLTRRDLTDFVAPDNRLDWRSHLDASDGLKELLGSLLAFQSDDRPVDARAARREIARALDSPVDVSASPQELRSAEPSPMSPAAPQEWMSPQPSAMPANGVSSSATDNYDDIGSNLNSQQDPIEKFIMTAVGVVVLFVIMGTILSMCVSRPNGINASSGRSGSSADDAAPVQADKDALKSHACEPNKCEPISAPFKEHLEFGMTVEQARQARPELDAARRQSGGGVSVPGSPSGVASVAAPGPVLRTKMVLLEKPAQCEFAFFAHPDAAHPGLSQMKCHLGGLGSISATRSYVQTLAQRLASRYGLPNTATGITSSQSAGRRDNLDGTWTWRGDATDLEMSMELDGMMAGPAGMRFQQEDLDGLFGDMVSTLDLTQTSSAHRQALVGRAEQKARRIDAQAEQQRKRKRQERERLKNLGADDPL